MRRALARLVGAEVRGGEWPLVLLLFANLFFLLTAYYILKVIREPLILLEGGAVERSYARGVQAGLLLVLLPAYGLLVNRFEPARLVKWVMGAFVLCVGVFVALAQLRVRVGFAFFVWLGIFSTVAIAQFWSLAADLMTESEGKRLFPLVAAGGTLGGIFGSQLAARLLEGRPHQMMLVAAAILFSCTLLTHMTYGAAEQHRAGASEAPPRQRDRRGGFALILGQPYLLAIALLVLMLNFVTSTGDFMLAELVGRHALTLPQAERVPYLSGFYAEYQTAVSVLSALLQILLVGRSFKVLGVGGSVLVLPLLMMSGYAGALALPLLAFLAGVKLLESAGYYSLQNTVQQSLFLRASRDAKYKAKAAVDTLFVRLGDLASTGAVMAGAQLGVSVRGFALVNIAAAVAALGLALYLCKAGAAAPREWREACNQGAHDIHARRRLRT